jgi:hypothetical protein
MTLRWQEFHQFIKKVIKKKGVIIYRYLFFQLSLNYSRSSYAYVKLTDYLNANDILSPCQSGFRQNHSKMSSLLSNSDSWLVNMDAGLVNGVVFLDLRNLIRLIMKSSLRS